MTTIWIYRMSIYMILGPSVFTFLSVCLSVCLSMLCTSQFSSHTLDNAYLGCIYVCYLHIVVIGGPYGKKKGFIVYPKLVYFLSRSFRWYCPKLQTIISHLYDKNNESLLYFDISTSLLHLQFISPPHVAPVSFKRPIWHQSTVTSQYLFKFFIKSVM